MESTAPAPSLLRTLVWLTLFFVAAQILYFILSIFTAGIIHILAAQAITLDIIKSPAAFLPFLGYLGTQTLVYASYIFAIWYMANAAGSILKLTKSSIYSLGVVLWITGTAAILAANSIYFNQSIFAFSSHHFITVMLTQITYYFGCGVIGLAILLSCIHLITILIKRSFQRWDVTAVLVLLTATYFYADTKFSSTPVVNTASTRLPNIIIISVEALRPDFVTRDNTMPFLSEQLNASIHFTDAYTPIAQSFPSWISMLTGKTPLHHGARSFYANYTKLKMQHALTYQLKTLGYETIYAVDGQRFGDITTQLGFDRIISPPYGIAELWIGSMSDFPLSNLMLSTRLGKVLFPYSYANRTVAATYRPDDFIDLLTSTLKQKSGKPIFLSVHFGLSHWPYRYAEDHMHGNESLVEKYQHSLHAADEQIKKFHAFLSSEKILDHAIIVYMSDHGTGLGMPGDSLTNINNYIGKKSDFSFLQKLPYSHNSDKGYDTSYGYSTDILSMQQYRVILGIQTHGMRFDTPQTIRTRVSLLDVTPTILDLLHAPVSSADGISLLGMIQHPDSHTEREFFFENGFTSPEIAQASMSTANVLNDSISTVTLDSDTGLLYLTDTAENNLLKHKQRAVLAGDWLLARYTPHVMILANIKSGKWTTDWNSTLAKSAPLKKLLRDFEQYNGSEI